MKQCIVLFLLLVTLIFCVPFSDYAFAGDFDFLQVTNIIEIKQGSPLSDKIALYRLGGYELSGGAPVSFNRWYSTNWTDARMTYMTQLHPKAGIIWGFGTGEAGRKYTINPSLKLGLVFRHELDSQSALSLKATTTIGGMSHESPCTADYGAIGGVQQVNCRLAAGTMAPSQTMKYIFNDKPFNANIIWLEYKATFK